MTSSVLYYITLDLLIEINTVNRIALNEYANDAHNLRAALYTIYVFWLERFIQSMDATNECAPSRWFIYTTFWLLGASIIKWRSTLVYIYSFYALCRFLVSPKSIIFYLYWWNRFAEENPSAKWSPIRFYWLYFKTRPCKFTPILYCSA